jgi:hypothetical protein
VQRFWAAIYPRVLLYAAKRAGRDRAEDIAQGAIKRVWEAGTWDIDDAQSTILSVGSAVNSLASHARRKEKKKTEMLEYANTQDDATEGGGGDRGDDRTGLLEDAAGSGPTAEEVAVARAKHAYGLRLLEEARKHLDEDDRLGHRLLDALADGDVMDAEELAEGGDAPIRDVYNARKRVKRALEAARELIPDSARGSDDPREEPSSEKQRAGYDHGKRMPKGSP